MKVHLASVYEKILSSMKVNLSSSKVNSSSGEVGSSGSKVTFSRGLILKSIVCCVCVMFSSDVSWGMENDEEKSNDLNKKNDEIEINVKKTSEVSVVSTKATYKVFLLGDTEVGKTQIINKGKNGEFVEQFISTICIDFNDIYYEYTIKNYKNKQFIKLQIWDTSGRENFKSTNKESFKNIQDEWLQLAKGKATKDALYFLVGNKTDMENEGKRNVRTEDAQNFAGKNNMQFFEVSAKTGDKIEDLFNAIAKACIKKDIKEENLINNNVIDINTDYDTSNDKTHSKNKRCNCCPCCNKDEDDKKEEIKSPETTLEGLMNNID